jgi:hypothetical protein
MRMVRMGELIVLNDDALLDRLGGAQAGSAMAYAVEMEFKRRGLTLEREVAAAQIAAAKASKTTAIWTCVSAIGILLTVVVTAVGMLWKSG